MGRAYDSPGPSISRGNQRIPGTRRRLFQFTDIGDCTGIPILKIFDACSQRAAIEFIDEVRRRLPFSRVCPAVLAASAAKAA